MNLCAGRWGFEVNKFDNFVRWMWGPYDYPRWLRRVYIVFWPILMPIRWVPFWVAIICAMVIWAIYKVIYEAIKTLYDGVTGLSGYLRKQWG